MAFLVLCATIAGLGLDARTQVLRQASDDTASLAESLAREVAAEFAALDRSRPGAAQPPKAGPGAAPTLDGAGGRAAQRVTLGAPPDGAPLLRWSRQIVDADGTVGTAVDTLRLPDGLEPRLAHRPNAALVLWGEDGPALMQTAGGLTVLDHLRIPVASGGSAGARGEYQGKLTPHDVERLIGFRRVGTFPLWLGVGIPVADIYAVWRLKAVAITIVLASFLGIAGTLARGLHTELRRRAAAEAALAASIATAEEANRQLVLSEKIARVGHWRLTLATGELTWSDETYRIHGVDRATFKLDLESGIAAYHADDRAAIRAMVQQTIRDAGSFERSARIVTPDGAVRHVACRGLCELDEAGEVSSLFGTIVDESDVRQAEDALRESEARYRLLAETTNDVITCLDLEFKRTYVSPACRTLLGFEPEELLGKRPSDSVHPDDVSALREQARVLMAGETAAPWVRATYRTRHKAGHWVWVEAAMSVGHDEKTGAQNALICSLRDVTARREAEAAIEASEARFRLLAENTSELIMLGHDDGRQSYISPAAFRLLGFEPAELGAMRLHDYVHPDDRQRLGEVTRSLSETRNQATIVCRARHKTRGWLPVEGLFRRVPQAEAGEPTIVATFRDVSEREAQSDALRAAKDAAERSQRAAEQASTAKSEFLASMSHEIRTPLNAILGYTDLLLHESALDAGDRRSIERVQSAGNALLTVVNDILDISKIEAGRVELEARAFRLEACVENAVAMIDTLAASKHLALSASIDPAIPAVLVGDEDRLRQILLNLLNNAVKFTPAGAVDLAVRCATTERDRAILRFTVRDTGIGIPADKRPRLFQRFSQVDSSIARKFGGTGLGLSICKSLVEMMGGAIGVDSNPGGGSTFWFTVSLPIAARDSATPAAVRDPACARASAVLLVEDNEINQDLARSVIEAGGHTVRVVGDGIEAIEAVQEAEYDVVLMDVQMPRMDGVTATRHIRALEGKARNVPIVAMTANVLSDQVASYRAAGMNDIVGKPFKRAELYAAIARWTASAAQPEAPRLQPAALRPAFDRSVYDELVDLMGPADLARLVGMFAIQLDSKLSSQSLQTMDRPGLARTAHEMVSAAGSLGFSELSGLCSQLEGASVGGGATDTLIKAVEDARERVAATLRELQRAA